VLFDGAERESNRKVEQQFTGETHN